MKKIILFLACLLVCFNFAGCSFLTNDGNDKPNKNIVDKSSTITIEDVSFKVNSISDTQSFLMTTGNYETTENNFVLINLYVENNSQESINFSGDDFALIIESTNQVISYYAGYTYLLPDCIVKESNLNPTFSGNYNIVFETKSTTTTENYLFRIRGQEYNVWSDDYDYGLIKLYE